MEKDYVSIIGRIINKYQDKLTDWEIDFISNIYNYHVLNKKELSDKQKNIILRINGKILGRDIWG